MANAVEADGGQAARYRRQPDAELSRMEIMEAAASCFEERGFAAASLDEVAARINSTKGRIYHHYRSKADLFFDVYRTGMAMNLAAIEPFLQSDAPAIERLSGMVRAHIRSIILTKPFQNVVMKGVEMLRQGGMREREAELRELARLRDTYSDHFLAVMQAARLDGTIDFQSPNIAVNQLFMSMNGPILWFSKRPAQSDAEIEAVIDECALYAMRLLNFAGRSSGAQMSGRNLP